MPFKIDNDIPPPPTANYFKDKGISRTLHKLTPGQSFLIPGRTTLYASRIIHREKKRRPGSDFAARTLPEGVRIWCLADPAFDLLT